MYKKINFLKNKADIFIVIFGILIISNELIILDFRFLKTFYLPQEF